MNIVVTGRNVEVTPALRQYAEEKIGKVERYLSDVTEAVVTLSIQKYMHKAEVLIKANGSMLQAEGVTEELYTSIDEVASKLDKQAKKLKGKIKSYRKSDTKGRAMADESPAPGPVGESGMIIDRKQFKAKPMPPEEAAMQLDMQDLNFFMFTNSQSGEVNVIYKRKDGNFGLIEPVSK